jgi:hypothetical protein
MLSEENMLPRLAALSEAHRSAVALTSAARVSSYFEIAFPHRSRDLAGMLDKCWQILMGKTANFNWEEISEAAQEMVPTSMDEPEAGPAIPAGETALNALEATIQPTPEKAYQAIMSAYTTVEMSSFLSMYPPDQDSAAIDGEGLDSRMRKVYESDAVTQFKQFLDKLVSRAEAGAGLSEIRALWRQ